MLGSRSGLYSESCSELSAPRLPGVPLTRIPPADLLVWAQVLERAVLLPARYQVLRPAAESVVEELVANLRQGRPAADGQEKASGVWLDAHRRSRKRASTG